MSWPSEDAVDDGHIIGVSVDGPALRLERIRLCHDLAIGAAASLEHVSSIQLQAGPRSSWLLLRTLPDFGPIVPHIGCSTTHHATIAQITPSPQIN